MNKAELIKLNRDFYDYFASQFSATRQGFWAGWEKLQPYIAGDVLDVAAGNLRFKKFLDANKILYENYLAVDGSVEMMKESSEEKKYFRAVDILQDYLENREWTENIFSQSSEKMVSQKSGFDFVICSAFFHHIPSAVWREKMLTSLLSLVKKGGYLAVSYWLFLAQENTQQKIIKDLGAGDFLLSFAGDQSHPRYCHYFSDEEIKAQQKIASDYGATLVVNYLADGKSGTDNRYLIWRKT